MEIWENGDLENKNCGKWKLLKKQSGEMEIWENGDCGNCWKSKL